jgi:zinc transport system permease protein
LGVLLNINPIFGALGTTILAAIGMEGLRKIKNIFGESILAIFLSGSLAIAIILISFAKGLNVNFISYLFGSITTVTQGDIVVIVSFGVVVFSLLVILYKQLFLVTYDEDMALASGMPVKALNLALVIFAAMTISIAMRIVGTLLISALMVIPVVTALQYKQSFLFTTIIAVVVGLVSVLIGLFASFYLNLPSGGTIVITSLLFFTVSIAVNKFIK